MADLKSFAAGDANAAKAFSSFNGAASPFVPTLSAVVGASPQRWTFFRAYHLILGRQRLWRWVAKGGYFWRRKASRQAIPAPANAIVPGSGVGVALTLNESKTAVVVFPE